MSDPELLHFNYTVTGISSTEIDIKFTWDNPFEISQNNPAERLEIVVNMDKFTDNDGLSLSKDVYLACWIPR